MRRSAPPLPADEAVTAPLAPCVGTEIGASLQRLGLEVRPLPGADDVTPAAVQAAVVRRRATIFRGLVDHWPALVEWTPPRLVAEHGGTMVTPLMEMPGAGVLFPGDQRQYERTLTLADFVAVMLSASPEAPCYLAYKRANEIFPAEDHDFTSLLGGLDTETDTRAWIGSAGTRSMLHSDLKDNLFCQVWGEKHIVLLAWEDSPAAYPFPDNIVNSQVDLANLDLDRYPRLRDAVLYAGTVRPGDVLLIPRGWWHDIRAMTPSVSLNHWFGRPLGLWDYLPLLLRLGPRCWWATARGFVRSGILGRQETVNFFFSPPSTGKRLFDALRWGDFSHANDPSD
jgi:Cupin-like domain